MNTTQPAEFNAEPTTAERVIVKAQADSIAETVRDGDNPSHAYGVTVLMLVLEELEANDKVELTPELIRYALRTYADLI